MSDRAHLNGQSRPSIHVEPAAPDHNEAREDQFDAPTALLRLLVGGVLVGADELRDRLRTWDATTRATAMPPSAPTASAPPHSSTSLRHALIGMVFESEMRVRRRFATALARLERLTEEAEAYYDESFASDDMRQTPLVPLLTRLDDLFFALETTVERWTVLGEIEELHGRRMARQASVGVMDELLDYMARNPEVRQLIEQQATSMAGVAVDEVRGRTVTADLWIERLAHRVLRRPMSDTHSDDMGTLETPLAANDAQTVAPPASLQTAEPTDSVTSSVWTSPAMGIMEAAPNADSGG